MALVCCNLLHGFFIHYASKHAIYIAIHFSCFKLETQCFEVCKKSLVYQRRDRSVKINSNTRL